MGIGLIVAVLGIGSTFAANIQINEDDTSEFGQGLTQTVYCGESAPATITVAPISAFVNSTDINDDVGGDVWRQPVYTGRTFVRVSSIPLLYAKTKNIENDETGEPENTRGYYITSRTGEDDSYFTDLFRPAPTGADAVRYNTFVPQVVRGTSYGFYKYTSWRPGFSVSASAAKFELGGITISGIPDSCNGRDFIISAYGEELSPLELIDDLDVTEIAVKWESATALAYSFDRRTLKAFNSNPEEVVIERVADNLEITFISSIAGRLLTSEFTQIVVETQENIV
jgi:hypothetical protein